MCRVKINGKRRKNFGAEKFNKNYWQSFFPLSNVVPRQSTPSFPASMRSIFSSNSRSLKAYKQNRHCFFHFCIILNSYTRRRLVENIGEAAFAVLPGFGGRHWPLCPPRHDGPRPVVHRAVGQRHEFVVAGLQRVRGQASRCLGPGLGRGHGGRRRR